MRRFTACCTACCTAYCTVRYDAVGHVDSSAFGGLEEHSRQLSVPEALIDERRAGRAGPFRRYTLAKIAFNVALGRIAAEVLASSGR